MLKCKHQCYCACSLEIGTRIIDDAGRPVAHKKQRFILVLKININFQRKKNFLKELPNLTTLYRQVNNLYIVTGILSSIQ
jgi:hypothetical protein